MVCLDAWVARAAKVDASRLYVRNSMSIPQPPDAPASGPFGPVVRKVKAISDADDTPVFSHQRPDGFRVYVSPSGRMEVRPPLADAWKGLVP